MADEWAINLPNNKQIRLSDFTLDELVQLELDCDEEWWALLSHPFKSARTAKYIYAAACAQQNIEPVVLTVRMLTDVFVQVPDDMPDVYEGSIPKAVEDPQTLGSSGVQSDSTGPQNKPDA
jgi:hypothetical protein